MRHIITGGSGFTGSVLTKRLLEKGQEVVNIDIREQPNVALRKNVHFVHADVTDSDTLKKLHLKEDDVVYHLAARQFADAVPKKSREEWFNEVNVCGTKAVVNEMKNTGCHKLVFFSTDMTYGIPTVCPVPPDHPQNPLGPYGNSKILAEKIIRGEHSIDATIFRPRLITGPGRLGILGKLFKLIQHGIPVPMIGNGNNRYQMVSVEDCALAAELAVDKNCPNMNFNLGSATPPTTKELLNGVIKHAKSKSILLPIPASLLKPVLATMDKIGLTLLYPEQFGIADKDVLLDTTLTYETLGWSTTKSDIVAMSEAYDSFIRK
ncbi:NAD(P)-dependent oxidoreductase [Citrobacter freundii]|uniref:NAD-dependent epimerase/dehydratase family protein n=1 Tax=Citrobacter freundii TaxID=546 RepID=UPI0015F54313|nr:NAD(P)-dependent oxidoreductase [Citrobacter freundii]